MAGCSQQYDDATPRNVTRARRPHIPVRYLVGLVMADAVDRCDQGSRATMSTPSGPGARRLDPGPSAIMSERRQLINLAYRLLGSLAKAEDAVQETYARWSVLFAQQ